MQSKQNPWWRGTMNAAWLPVSIGLLVGLLGVKWLLSLPQWTKLDFDEANNLAKPRLLRSGYTLYRDVWSDQPPLFTWMTLGFEKLLGVPIDADATAARLLVLCLSVGFVMVAVDVARRAASGSLDGSLRGWKRQALLAMAGLVAAVLLIGMKQHGTLGISLMIGLPALALAGVGLWLAWLSSFFATGRWSIGLAFASGVFLACGLFVKLNVFMLIPAMLLLLWLGERRVGRIGSAVAGVATVTLLMTIGLFLSKGDGLYAQLIAPHVTTVTGDGAKSQDESTRFAGARSFGEQLSRNFEEIEAGLLSDVPHVALAVLGIGMAITVLRRRQNGPMRPVAWLVVALTAWAATALVFLPFASPMWPHHRTLFTLPIALIGGVAVAWSLVALVQWKQRALWPDRVVPILTVGLAVAAVFGGIDRAARAVEREGQSLENRGPIDVVFAARLLREVPGSGFAFADDPMLAMSMGRLPLPEVAVPSMKRRRRGLMSDAMIGDLIERERPDLLVMGRFIYSDAFLARIESDYRRVFGPVPDKQLHQHRAIYVRRDLPVPEGLAQLDAAYAMKRQEERDRDDPKAIEEDEVASP
jgi:hypothetical protein